MMYLTYQSADKVFDKSRWSRFVFNRMKGPKVLILVSGLNSFHDKLTY
jgi:hypothetical protein